MVKVYCQNCSGRCVGDVLKVGSNYFHQNCFKCEDCKKNLDTGGFFCRNGSYFCADDYTLRFSNNCFICQDKIYNDIVSALDRHFHKQCFKCNSCSKNFSPGDRVIMKKNQFMCESCLSIPVAMEVPASSSLSHSDVGKCKSFSKSLRLSEGVTTPETNIPTTPSNSFKFSKESPSDDITTDQGYISGDPASIASPTTQNEKPIRSSGVSVAPTADRIRKQFQFGQFYNKSYLKIKEDLESLRMQQRQEKIRGVMSQTLPNTANGDELALSEKALYYHQQRHNRQQPQHRYYSTTALSHSGGERKKRSRYNQNKATGGMWSLFSIPRFVSRTSYHRNIHDSSHQLKDTISEGAPIETDGNEEIERKQQDDIDLENVVRSASYPDGKKPPPDWLAPLDRDDWPSLLYSTVIYREKMLQRVLNATTSSVIDENKEFDTSPIDCTQSLDQLSPSYKSRVSKLIEVLYGPDKGSSLRLLNQKIISASRSPNANTEPLIATRYMNHRDKSNSRDLNYFKSMDRYKGSSIDYISSTSRPYLAGQVENKFNAAWKRKPIWDAQLETALSAIAVRTNKADSQVTRERVDHLYQTETSNVSDSGVGGTSVDPVNNTSNRILSQKNNNCINNFEDRIVDLGLIWTATRTMSETFDVRLKPTSEYDSTMEETTILEHQDELTNPTTTSHQDTNNNSSSRKYSSFSDIDLVTGLRCTKTRIQHGGSINLTSDPERLSTASSISMEHWPYWSHKMTSSSNLGSANFNTDRSSMQHQQQYPIYSYAELVNRDVLQLSKRLDLSKLEAYLSVDEFQMIFGLNRIDFYRLPEWKQNDLKRRVELY